MAHSVVALYDDFDNARRVVEELVSSGFDREDISLVANDENGKMGSRLGDLRADEDVTAGEGAGFGAVVGTLIGLGVALIPGIGPVIAAGPLAAALMAGIGAAAGAATGGIAAGLIDLGMPEEEAGYYNEGIRRGGTLVTVNFDDDTYIGRAQDVMNRYNPVDVENRAAAWESNDWSNESTSKTGTIGGRLNDLNRPTSAPSGASNLDRVEEELQAEQRHVEDGSVRVRSYMTPMSVEERTGSMAGMTYRPYSDYETDFRTHYDSNYSTSSDASWDQFTPAYRYGYTLATTDRYGDYDWTRLEPEARQYWEERNPNTWDRFKDSVREAWDRVRGR